MVRGDWSSDVGSSDRALGPAVACPSSACSVVGLGTPVGAGNGKPIDAAEGSSVGAELVVGAHVYGVGAGEDGTLGACVGVPDVMGDGLTTVGP